MLVGIPSIRDNDRFRGYREDVLGHVEKALFGVEHQLFITPPQSKRGLLGVVNASNLLVDKCIGEGFDYLWLVQGDVEVPPDAFERLHALDADVAQGVVPRHNDREALICGFMDEALKVWYLPRQAVQGQVLSGWVFAGLSCTLIKRHVLEAGIRFKYQPGIGEDILFLYDAQSRGFVAKVHGSVLCGHLPEWPLPGYLTLDVGCGHEPKGRVNVDLFPEATAHRSADQQKCDDQPLDVKNIPNFVRADASHLPFKDGAFRRVYSGHTIEHVEDPEAMIAELLRVSSCEVEITCPHAESPWGSVACKPLHVNALRPEWFKTVLEAVPSIDFEVSCNSYGEGPGDIFVKVRKKRLTYD